MVFKIYTLELKIDKVTEYVIGWKRKRVYISKLKPLNDAFLTSIKNFGSKIGKRFNNTPLVVEQNNCTTKTVNVSIVYDLDN